MRLKEILLILRYYPITFLVLATLLIPSRNAYCATSDSSSVVPSSYGTPTTYIYDAPPAYQPGYYLLLNDPPTFPSISCPSGTTKTVLLYARQYYTKQSACVFWRFSTNNQSGEYLYFPFEFGLRDQPVSARDAAAMTMDPGYDSTAGSCLITNYVRYNWFQHQGYATHPTDCTIGVSASCGTTTWLYNFSPVQYSTSSFPGFSSYSISAPRMTTPTVYAAFYDARIACTSP